MTARHTLLGALISLSTAITVMAVESDAHMVDSMPPKVHAASDSSSMASQVFDFDFLYEEIPDVNPGTWVDTALVQADRRQHEGRYAGLTEDDYREVAEELGVETAAIKAVVDIEAGSAHQGFWAPGKPLINFDLSMYRKFAPRYGVSLSKARKSHPEIFCRPDVRRHGSYQGGQQARLDAACSVDSTSALESTFWGMFQIGGFNWRKCDTGSVGQFVEMMSRSERDQLELFARFIQHNGMVEAIRKKNWLRFALIYNGPKAKSRGYHKRLAAAYRRHKARETAR